MMASMLGCAFWAASCTSSWVGTSFDVFAAEIGDDRYAVDSHAGVIGNYDFRHCRYADGVAADHAEVFIFGRGLESGAGCALHKRHA